MVKRVRQSKEQSYTQWIERNAHKKLKVRKVHFSRYLFAPDVCRFFHISPEMLYELVATSSEVHGLICDSGALFIHPDGFNHFMQSWGLESARAGVLLHPITRKELLFD